MIKVAGTVSICCRVIDSADCMTMNFYMEGEEPKTETPVEETPKTESTETQTPETPIA